MTRRCLHTVRSAAKSALEVNIMLDILVVSPHPDDAELGMGGAILKFRAEGLAVGVLDLTDGEPTPFGSPQIRRQETAEATRVLGIHWRENLGLPNRSLEATLEARAQLAAVFRRTQPRWIFAPYWIDAHPDHVAATELIEAARFWAKLTKTELPGRPHYPERIFITLHSPADRSTAGVRVGHQRLLGPEAAGDRMLPEPVHRRPAAGPAHVYRPDSDQAATWGWSIGSATASRLPAASRWD